MVIFLSLVPYSRSLNYMKTNLSFVGCTVIFLSLVECTVNFLLFSSLYSTYSESPYI